MPPMNVSLNAAPAIAKCNLDDLETQATHDPTVARCLIVGLPSLGILASLFFDLPLFAALMAGSFLLATALVCGQAMVRFTGQTLRLLVTSRLVITLVVGAVLFCATGAAWAGLVSALLFWLTADRLLGRHSLHELGKSAHEQETAAPISQINGATTHLFPSAAGTPDPVARLRRRGAKG